MSGLWLFAGKEENTSMELSELTEYASEKYQIKEEHKWTDFPGFSVLCHPQTGKWVALLMRQWDTDTGTEIQRCDIKCGSSALARFHRPYLSPPVRMHGSKWVGVCFDERTEREIVFELLDQAIASENPHGFTIVLESKIPVAETGYRETALPVSGSIHTPVKEQQPEKLRKMRHLYEYGRESAESRARNFWRQAVFMQDYEDDCPWTGGDFVRYFPTYHDLTTRQLRGYFTWRTRLRRGEYEPIASSAAYIYIYELLNGIGTASPEECLQKLQEFEKEYLDSGMGDERMRSNLRRWMMEFAIVHALPAELARSAADPEMIARDTAIAVLESPENHTDEDIFHALCYFGGKKIENSPVLGNDRERGMHLFCETWRAASAYCSQEKNLFTLCFGKKLTHPWYPFSNAVYYEQAWAQKTGRGQAYPGDTAYGQAYSRDAAYRQTHPRDMDYELDECRRFSRRNGSWTVEAYEKLSFDKHRLQGLLHETDARLRRYLKTGRYLRENEEDAWAIPYIDAVIEADRKAVLEAARPKITIDLSGLEKIRRDALITQDSLLIEDGDTSVEDYGATSDSIPGAEEYREYGDSVPPEDKHGENGGDILPADEQTRTADSALHVDERQRTENSTSSTGESMMSGIPLNPVQIGILRALLEGSDPAGIIREHHLMPSIVADEINEAFYDEIGDTVVFCEGDELGLVEDYIDDIAHCLGEAGN